MPACCGYNRDSGLCSQCVCVQRGRHCAECAPSRLGQCNNQDGRDERRIKRVILLGVCKRCRGRPACPPGVCRYLSAGQGVHAHHRLLHPQGQRKMKRKAAKQSATRTLKRCQHLARTLKRRQCSQPNIQSMPVGPMCTPTLYPAPYVNILRSHQTCMKAQHPNRKQLLTAVPFQVENTAPLSTNNDVVDQSLDENSDKHLAPQ